MEEEIKFIKKWIWWIIGVLFLVSAGAWFLSRSEKVMDTAFIRYEEFQEIYNTCTKLNTDLCNMNAAPADDPMFSQFSKTQRILAYKTQLNRWVEDYNAKSKMWNRSLWKSSKLPYQLSVNDFNCYQ